MQDENPYTYQSDVYAFGIVLYAAGWLLIPEEGNIYAATKSAVFEFHDERWHELSSGLIAGEVNSLAQDKQGNLYRPRCRTGL